MWLPCCGMPAGRSGEACRTPRREAVETGGTEAAIETTEAGKAFAGLTSMTDHASASDQSVATTSGPMTSSIAAPMTGRHSVH